MSSIQSKEAEELMDTLIKWWMTGNKEMRDEIRKYFFGLSFYNNKQKDIFWERMMKKANS